MTSQPSMTEHAPSSAVTISSSTSIPAATSAQIPPPSSSSSSSTAIPQPNSNSKPWRSKQLAAAQLERSETGSNTDPLEEVDGNVRPGINGTSNGTAYGAAPTAATTVSTTASSPKMALRGIAQRTFSRALTAKKSSVKSTEKDKDKGKEKEKEKGKEVGKRISAPDRTELRGDELKEEAAPVTADTDGSNKRTSKITSFIPKGGKVSKKESSTLHTAEYQSQEAKPRESGGKPPQ
ncbi:hypothetical protein F7725_026657 [Dissostichus mawsoni]|uniref:Uncharacterized protein n=1 Tax=Dissostichus mawsoni TaxID=36200 RepID=A0A7J5X7P2_DISMA|nr:hypothetical protein F7725_026657 [Dissostichus mawsoni]